MPQAISHVVIPIIVMSFIRDYYIKKRDRSKFPLHYVLIAGLAGLIPDIDVAVYWILYYFGYSFDEVHRTFSHTIFLPLIFFCLFIVFKNAKVKNKKSKFNPSMVFLMISIGILFHLILDSTLGGSVRPLYPFFNFSIGLNLPKMLPPPFGYAALPVLEAFLLVFWISYLEYKHKISDFI
jgi:membrane-bound metal-dependent hydrolase YbcI (DUF457 family)